ncbi:hypothetical protein [Xanthomarina sp. F2636L]|uniref:hypothetical protein n=1 Tax=Xanthomarina sp. F2636L TaxID=2996018 RepID=UPI00225E48A1|nr:hypothetical protein [Xanthomarina sp. F2636L]MCX7550510.1 hypothetical protein [Xanthomarina sp. F2636L]
MAKLVKQLVDYKKSDDKSGKVLKNRLVEILLVKVGILLALAIYGWYQDYVEQKHIEEYFVNIYHEVTPAIAVGKAKKKQTDSLIIMTKRCLDILNTKNMDSIIYLKDNLGPLVTVRSQSFEFPMVKEFLSKDYTLKVKSKQTVKLLRKLQQQLSNINQVHDYNNNQHQLVVEPFINKWINYSEVAFPNRKKLLVAGGPETQYDHLLNNLELWNLLTYKLEGYQTQTIRQESFTLLLQDLDKTLRKQLEIEESNLSS